MEFWPSIAVPGINMRQLLRCDVKMLECFVMSTHDFSKGNLVTGLPASTTFQIRCQVIGKSEHSLPPTSRVPPFPRGRSWWGVVTQGWGWWEPRGSSRSIRPRSTADQEWGTRCPWQFDSDRGGQWLHTAGWTSWVWNKALKSSPKMRTVQCIVWGQGSPRYSFFENGEQERERKDGWVDGWVTYGDWKDAEYPKWMPKWSCAKSGPWESHGELSPLVVSDS